MSFPRTCPVIPDGHLTELQGGRRLQQEANKGLHSPATKAAAAFPNTDNNKHKQSVLHSQPVQKYPMHMTKYTITDCTSPHPTQSPL